jgi:hypothetical protein
MITVRVTDSGPPNLHALRSFKAFVVLPPRVTGIDRLPGGNLSLNFQTIPGKKYQLVYKNDLGAPSWTPLGNEITAVSDNTTITDDLTGIAQRFYRILVVP